MNFKEYEQIAEECRINNIDLKDYLTYMEIKTFLQMNEILTMMNKILEANHNEEVSERSVIHQKMDKIEQQVKASNVSAETAHNFWDMQIQHLDKRMDSIESAQKS